MRSDHSPVLVEYLGRVRSHLPIGRSGDIVRELESSIRDRVDDLAARANRAPADEDLRQALAEMGEPDVVASAYTEKRSLVGPEDFRSFLTSTAIVFALHLALIGVATTLGRSLRLGPVEIAPAGVEGLVGTAAAVLHALCLDVGLMVLVFAATGETRRRLAPRNVSRRVDASPRTATGRIAIALLGALLLGVFRDRLFVVLRPDGSHPLFTEWFNSVAPLVVGVLGLSMLSDALYLVFDETRFTVAVDAVHGVAGLACMLYLLHGGPVLALPPLSEFGHFYAPVNDFLGQLGDLVIVAIAMMLAVKTVRRLLRFAQI